MLKKRIIFILLATMMAAGSCVFPIKSEEIPSVEVTPVKLPHNMNSLTTVHKVQQATAGETSSILQVKTEEMRFEEEEIVEIIAESWWTEEEFDLLCRVVTAEMGADFAPDKAQQGVAAVVINRARHEAFPNNIHNVVHQKGQYACVSYLHRVEPTERVRENVLKVLEEEVFFPEDVVWQANFPQSAWGTSVDIYEIYFTGTKYETYFCYYGKS